MGDASGAFVAALAHLTEASFPFPKIWSLYPAILGQAIPSAFGLLRLAITPYNYIKTAKYRDYNLGEMYKVDVKRGGICAWKAGAHGTVKLVKKIMSKNNVLVTRFAYEKKGQLFEATIARKKDLLPLKKSDLRLQATDKYGGYDGIEIAYFMYIEFSKEYKSKTERIRSIYPVPVYLTKQTYETLEEYCEKKGMKDTKIILPKIKLNTLLNLNGFYMYITGKEDTKFRINQANQLCISYKEEIYLKNVFKFKDRVTKYLPQIKEEATSKIGKDSLPEAQKKEKIRIQVERLIEKMAEYEDISKEKNLEIYDLYTRKLNETIYKERFKNQAQVLIDARERFFNSSLNQQCSILYEILHLFQSNAALANLKQFIGIEYFGKLAPSNEILRYTIPKKTDMDITIKSKYDYASIIFQSPTGLFKHKMDLLKL